MLRLIFAIVLINESKSVFVNFCLSTECQETANNMLNAINKSASTCQDFYEYSCGGFIEKTTKPNHQPLWNYWQSISEKIQTKLVALMELEHDPNLKKPQLMYNTCLEMDDGENLKQLKRLIDSLGGWPLAVGETWNKNGFNWGELAVKVIKNIGIYPILKIFPETDFNDTTQKILYIQNGDVNLPHSVLTNPSNYTEKIRIYKSWIFNVLQSVYPNSGQKNRIINGIKHLLNFEISLAKLYKNHDSKSKRISIRKLSQITHLNWLSVLKQLFSATNATLHENQQVIITSFPIFKKIILLLKTTKPNTIVDYIIWSVIKTFSRDTSKYLRQLNFFIEKTFFDLKSDTSLIQDCIVHVRNNFGFALVKNYVNLYMRPETIISVNEMVHKIKAEFVEMLNMNDWLTLETKTAAVAKVTALESLIGYPKWVQNTTLVDLFYEEIKITPNHFLNVLQMRQFHIKRELQKIEIYKEQWPINPFEVNAFYSILKNAIVIPIGIMEMPFFDVNRPEVFNYGALGSLIGHEISHALDTTGRQFDKNGELKIWWHQTDIQEYESKSECFELQYNRYKIDGFTTLGENIADNVGLKISYSAFKNSRNSNFPIVLPNVSFYSNDQLFFISFAQLWCEISSVNEFLNEGEHAPVKQRVLGSVANSAEFSKAYQCIDRDKKRCNLW